MRKDMAKILNEESLTMRVFSWYGASPLHYSAYPIKTRRAEVIKRCAAPPPGTIPARCSFMWSGTRNYINHIYNDNNVRSIIILMYVPYNVPTFHIIYVPYNIPYRYRAKVRSSTCLSNGIETVGDVPIETASGRYRDVSPGVLGSWSYVSSHWPMAL